MVTKKSPGVGDSFVWFLGRLMVVLMAVALFFSPTLTLAQEPDDGGEPAAAVETDEPAAEPAKKYEELPVDDLLKKSNSTIGTILMAGKFEGDQQKQIFDEYYQKYFLARWTQAKNIGSLPAYRKELRVSHLGRRSTNAFAHDHLNSLVLDFMKKLASGPYHPAVQVNAMLMIGELNSVEQPAPVPLPEAMEVLLGAVANVEVPDAIRAAAMVGIQRHVASGQLSAEVRKKLDSDLLKVASSDLPEGPAAQGREWIFGQAIDTLGVLGSVGENGAIAKLMLKTVADSKLSFSTRTIAAESLGNLSYAGATGINPVEATAVLGRFAIDACTDELQLVKEHSYPVSRRRMKQRLGAVVKALGGSGEERKGIASLAKEEAPKAFVSGLRKELDGMLKLLDDASHEGDDLEEPVDQFKGKLEKWLEQRPK